MESEHTTNRRAGRPRVHRTDPLRRTTIMLSESLIAQIDANQGEASSRNQWLIAAIRAYLNRSENAATQEDWTDLHAELEKRREDANRQSAALTRSVASVEAKMDALAHVAKTLSPEQRAFLAACCDYEGVVGLHGRWVALAGELSSILAQMNLLQQWSDAAVHPAAHQE